MEDLPSGFIDIDLLLADSHPEAKSVLVSYAEYFSTIRITEKNAALVLKLFSAKEPAVADKLLGEKDPLLLFSSVVFNRSGIATVLDILSMSSPRELYKPILLACLGVLIKTYGNARDGMTVYPLSISAVQHIAKYLTVADKTVQTAVMDILESLKTLPSKYPLAAVSARIIDTFYDNTKRLDTILPGSLLISLGI